MNSEKYEYTKDCKNIPKNICVEVVKFGSVLLVWVVWLLLYNKQTSLSLYIYIYLYICLHGLNIQKLHNSGLNYKCTVKLTVYVAT